MKEVKNNMYDELVTASAFCQTLIDILIIAADDPSVAMDYNERIHQHDLNFSNDTMKKEIQNTVNDVSILLYHIYKNDYDIDDIIAMNNKLETIAKKYKKMASLLINKVATKTKSYEDNKILYVVTRSFKDCIEYIKTREDAMAFYTTIDTDISNCINSLNIKLMPETLNRISTLQDLMKDTLRSFIIEGVNEEAKEKAMKTFENMSNESMDAAFKQIEKVGDFLSNGIHINLTSNNEEG